METQRLSSIITEYITERMQEKLAPINVQMEKYSAELTSMVVSLEIQQKLTEKRSEIIKKFEVRTWLTNAASRAEKISQATHAIKYFHGDAKGSSVYHSEKLLHPSFLSTATLNCPITDVVCNSSSNLDVAKFLLLRCNGISLLDCLKRGDHSALAALAENDAQLEAWVRGFMQALSDKTLSTHQLAKQLYFPVSDSGDYHLLSPMYSSSLAHALHQRISHSRFSEEAVAARKARREQQWHPADIRFVPDLAVQNVGGTKPQNISYLNSMRGGKNHLLRCAPPQWHQSLKPPVATKSVYTVLSPKLSRVVTEMRRYLHGLSGQEGTMEIRQNRAEYVDELIGRVFSYAAEIQALEDQQGWSGDEKCILKLSQQLWLDPLRQKTDANFRLQRESGDWISAVAEDFAHWLNSRLNKNDTLNMGAAEFREWSVLMRRRLSEFDAVQQEKWQ